MMAGSLPRSFMVQENAFSSPYILSLGPFYFGERREEELTFFLLSCCIESLHGDHPTKSYS